MASRRCGGSRGSSSGLRHELLDLSHHLRQERLYVQSEKVQVSMLWLISKYSIRRFWIKSDDLFYLCNFLKVFLRFTHNNHRFFMFSASRIPLLGLHRRSLLTKYQGQGDVLEAGGYVIFLLPRNLNVTNLYLSVSFALTADFLQCAISTVNILLDIWSMS